MKKVLFLPFMQLPTGHHQVADALSRSLSKRVPGLCVKKVDFLSYVGRRLEKVVAKTYLEWINHAPQSYDWAYRTFAYPSSAAKPLQWYESLFINKMEEMLAREQPDLIVCTQAYPSFLVGRLKEQGRVATPAVNVYTDFFINKIWGGRGIDYHFVADIYLKQQLMRSQRIPGERVFVTGIPVDESFTPSEQLPKKSRPYHILIAGGHGGLGDIAGLLQGMRAASGLRCTVLCGKNVKLLREIASWDMPHVRPLAYISSRQDMNDLYDRVDAIITKPGGVTVSEALVKKLPIFVHSALPGQEEINQEYLNSRGLVYILDPRQPCREQLLDVLEDLGKLADWRGQVETYLRHLDTVAWQKIVQLAQDQAIGIPAGLTGCSTSTSCLS